VGTPLDDLLAKSKGKPTQTALLDALRTMRRPPPFDTVGPLSELSTDKRPAVREAAIQALRNCSSPQAEDVLLEVLDRVTDRYCLTYANAALGDVGSKKAIPALERMLDQKADDVRGTAVHAIKKIAGGDALPLFVRVLVDDRSASVKWGAMLAINEHGDRSALEPVLQRVGSILRKKRAIGQLPKSELRAGLEFLARVGPDDPRVVAVFTKARAAGDKLFREERAWLEETPGLPG
jgi:HEAT repeat protein